MVHPIVRRNESLLRLTFGDEDSPVVRRKRRLAPRCEGESTMKATAQQFVYGIALGLGFSLGSALIAKMLEVL